MSIDVSGLSGCSAQRGPSARSCGARQRRAACACTSPSPARGWRRSARARAAGLTVVEPGGEAAALAPLADRDSGKDRTDDLTAEHAELAETTFDQQSLCALGDSSGVQTLGVENARRARGAACRGSGRASRAAGAARGRRSRAARISGRWCRRSTTSASNRRSSSSGRSKGSSRCRSC